MSGTPIVKRGIAYFGTYSIDEATHVLTVNIEGSTFPRAARRHAFSRSTATK